MFRTIVRCLAIVCVACNAYGDETATGTCTIVNPENQVVVIGIYRPTMNGIEERIISVPAKTQIHGIPIGLVDDEQFAIAYKSDVEGNSIRRSTPIKIIGHRSISVITRKRHPDTPDVLIEFRGFNEGIPSDQNALVIPRDELHAKMIMKIANQQVETVDSTLASVQYSSK